MNNKIQFFLFFLILLSTALTAQVPVDEFMGINTRRQDPIDRMQAVGFIREYHDWYLNEGFPEIPFNENGSPGYPNSQYRWNEAYQELTYTRYDDFYQEIQDSNIIICPTTLGNILQIIDPSGNIAFNDPSIGQILEQKPIAPGADSLNPSAYIAHAEYLYHYAARYGSTTFSPARANAIIAPKLHPNETLKTGLGNITYLEDWNEQDKTYYPNFPKTFFEPDAYAAMLSADFDGHQQSLGLMSDPDSPNNMISTVGIKNADPNMQVVMGGLTDADLQYVRDMVTWFKANRSANSTFGQLPLDAINIHIYVGDNPQVLASTFGISPESAGIKQILNEFVEYRDSLMPGIELWLSEFGYDTNDNSPISVPAIGDNDNYEVQGQWIIRFYLETIAAGFDRAVLFDLRDICTQPACALFQSSGLLENLDSLYRPKNSWYYTYTMKNVLKGMNFDADLSACQDTTCTKVYRFTDPQNNNKKVYAVWSPTATDTTYQYQLSLEGATTGTLVELELPSIYGVPSAISETDPMITVGERPVFVVVGDTYFTPSPCIANLTTDNTTCSTTTLNWDDAGGAQQFQLWRQNGHITKADFSHRVANIIDDEIDATTGTYTVANLEPATDYTFFLIPQGVGISDTDNYCSIQLTTDTGNSTCQIPLDASMIFDANTSPINAANLVDEQASLDPICQPAVFPSTLWGVNFNDDGMEQASFDLQAYYYIDAISIYDASAIGVLTVQIADSPNGPWTTVEIYQTIDLNKWITFTNSIAADKPIRYLRLVASDDDRAQIGELSLCGRLSDFTTDIAPGMPRNVMVEGINCFSADLTWEHPFDEDISHYKVIYGNEMQLFPYTAGSQAVSITDLEPGITYNFQLVTIDSIGQASDTLTVNVSTLPEGSCDLGCNPSCPCQICLNPSWISAETPGNTVPVSNLVDEQHTVNICGQVGTTPTTGWGYDFGSVLPVAILDLQQVYQLESFRFYDSNGTDNFKVAYKDDQGNWVELFDLVTISFNSWVLIDNLNVAARYLRISDLNNGARVNEIAICGYPLCTETITTELFDTLCQGQSIVFNDLTLNTSGVYFDTLQTVDACDSFIVLNLSVFNTVRTEIEETICQGDTYYFNDQNLTGAGTYRDTLVAANTCDSFVVLTLNLLDTARTEMVETICQGEAYYFNNQNLTTAGAYRDTFTAINTCDSFVVLTLNVLDTARTEIEAAICQGDTYHFNGQDLATAGIYRDTLVAVNTCDSFIVLALSILVDGDDCDDGNSNTINDKIDHNCNCVGEIVTTATCDVEVEVNEDTIKVNNLTQPITRLDIFNDDYSQTVYSCGNEDCNLNEVIPDLANGRYHVKVQSWTANNFAQRVCDTIIEVDIEVNVVPPSTTCDVEVEVNEDTIKVNNLTQPITRLDVFNDDYSQTVYTCGNEDCNLNEVIPDLANGRYHVKVQSWTANDFAQRVCDTIIDVDINVVPPSTTCDVEVEVDGNTIKVNNLTQPITRLDVFNDDYSQTVYSCGNEDCNLNEVIPDLANGRYHVKVQSWTANDFAHRVCDTIIDVDINVVSPSTTCDVEVEVDGNSIKVNNLTQPITRLDVFNDDYSQTVYSCGNEDCNLNKVIPDLANGRYHVKVQSWTANDFAQRICDTIIDVDINVVPPSTTCDVEVEVDGNSIKVNNLTQPITRLDIFNDDYSQTVYSCGNEDCSINEVIPNLADGRYHVKVQSWTANDFAQRICDTIIDVEIGMMAPSVCDVAIVTGNDYISVTNLDEPLVSIFIFSGDYHTTLFHCDYGDCPPFKTLTGLAAGAYVVKVQTYTTDFDEEVCNFLQTVIVGSNNCYSDNMTHFFGILETGMYQAENSIMSSGQVMEDTIVTFAASNSITLSAGFQASAGSSFTAMIDNCSNNFTAPVVTSRSTDHANTIDSNKFLKIAPNPFKGNTRIQYQLPNQIQNISLFIYDMTGQIIQNPIREQEQTKGVYIVDLQADNLLSGMYYVALQIDGEVLIEKIVVMN